MAAETPPSRSELERVCPTPISPSLMIRTSGAFSGSAPGGLPGAGREPFVGSRASAAAGGADYVQLAAIYAPRSKPATRPALEPGALGEAARAGLPVLAQGGVGRENAGACLAAGAVGIAVTGAILMDPDPGAAAKALRETLDAAAA